MERIIATTDLSTNSRAGMRFAIQLARSRGASLTFLQVHYVLRASMWSDGEYEYYVRKTQKVMTAEMLAFVKSVYRSLKIPPDGFDIALHQELDTVQGIIDYSSAHEADYVCISTRGAGVIRKLFGTVTSKLISRSPVPVLCIPSQYRLSPMQRVLYASDMEAYEEELARVIKFARPLKAPIDMLHLAYSYEVNLDQHLAEEMLKKKMGKDVSLHFRPRDTNASVFQDIMRAVKEMQPSVLVLFTHQHRDFYDRLLSSNNAEAYAFCASIPLLSFSKDVVEGQPDKSRPVAAGAMK